MAQSNHNGFTDTKTRSENKKSSTIGTATQDNEGAIILTLRANSSDGALGDAQFRYTPSDPDYEMIKAHVGHIPKGGSVEVRPFDEK